LITGRKSLTAVLISCSLLSNSLFSHSLRYCSAFVLYYLLLCYLLPIASLLLSYYLTIVLLLYLLHPAPLTLYPFSLFSRSLRYGSAFVLYYLLLCYLLTIASPLLSYYLTIILLLYLLHPLPFFFAIPPFFNLSRVLPHLFLFWEGKILSP